MARTIITVTSKYGTFTRQSARPYAYCVVATRAVTDARIEERATGERREWERQIREYGPVARGERSPRKYGTREGAAEQVAWAEARLAGHAARREKLLAENRALLGQWCKAASFSGSLAGAQKMALKLAAWGHCAKIIDVATGVAVATYGAEWLGETTR